MNSPTNSASPMSATVVRWVARILSVLIVLFWGYMIVAHLMGEEARPSGPRTTHDSISFAMVVVSLVGLAVAWKWEFTGATITLLAVLIGAAVNWGVLSFPGTLIPIAAVLFLSCWWLSRAPRGDKPARTSTG